MKSFIAVSLAVVGIFVASSLVQVYAAAPDGSGPWADSVYNFSQGQTKAGGVIDPIRSDASQALGVAEQTVTPGTFVSLGFGGSLTLQFDNGISNGVFVVESTNPNYPVEQAQVDLSADGTTWFSAGTLNQTGSVTQPESLTCAKYVRVTDTSNKEDFSDDTADGYDVDGIQATEGEACTVPTPTPVPCNPQDEVQPERCITPTPTPTTEVTPTPTPYTPPSDHGDGKSDGGSSCPSCTHGGGSSSNSNVLGASTEAGDVLGASTDTLAATGTTNMLVSIVASIGVSALFLMIGLRLSAKKV